LSWRNKSASVLGLDLFVSARTLPVIEVSAFFDGSV
jgi:hypothetical protein